MQCIFIKEWPANSPDINLIETFVALMKEAVAKICTETVDELKSVIQAVWESFEQNLRDDLVKSFLYEKFISNQ